MADQARCGIAGALFLTAGAAAAAQGAPQCVFEQPQLVAADGQGGDGFGTAVAIDGDWMAVGAPLRPGAGIEEGAVYLFQEVPLGWAPAGTLTGSQVDEGDTYGYALDMDGDTLVVGAPENTVFVPGYGAYEPGRIYVYELNGAVWNEVFVWTPPGIDLRRFGTSVAIDGNTIVAGGPFDDGNLPANLNPGAVWVFEKQAGSWSMTQKLFAQNPNAGEAWGWSVTIDDDRIAAGAVQGLGIGPGCVRIFERAGAVWNPVAEFLPPDGIPGDWFGSDVSLSQNELAIGAPYAGATGAIYVYSGGGATWNPTGPRYTAPGTVYLGTTVELVGDQLVGGDAAPPGAFVFNGNSRAVLFGRTVPGWAVFSSVQPSSASTNDAWATGVDLDGETLVLGGPGADNVTINAGAVAPFEIADGPVLFCVAKQNSQLCTPAMSITGTPSMSAPQPFVLDAANVISNRAGLLFFGITGTAAIPWQGGTLCVFPPIRRTPLQWSFGNTPSDCSGALTFDFNAYIQAGNEPTVQAGMPIAAQYWYRDPDHSDGTGSGLSDAADFTFCP